MLLVFAADDVDELVDDDVLLEFKGMGVIVALMLAGYIPWAGRAMGNRVG